MLCFSVFIVFATSSSAQFMQFSSLPEIFANPKTKNAYENTHAMCKHHEGIHDAYTSSLFCQSNGMKLKCDADWEVIQRLVSEEVISDKEIIEVCEPESRETSCVSNKWIGIASLICTPSKYERAVDELTKYAMESVKPLPISLEQLKREPVLNEAQKERIMRAYLRYHPRYLWGVYKVRESQ